MGGARLASEIAQSALDTILQDSFKYCLDQELKAKAKPRDNPRDTSKSPGYYGNNMARGRGSQKPYKQA